MGWRWPVLSWGWEVREHTVLKLETNWVESTGGTIAHSRRSLFCSLRCTTTVTLSALRCITNCTNTAVLSKTPRKIVTWHLRSDRNHWKLQDRQLWPDKTPSQLALKNQKKFSKIFPPIFFPGKIIPKKDIALRRHAAYVWYINNCK